jgi:hypothetical protein
VFVDSIVRQRGKVLRLEKEIGQHPRRRQGRMGQAGREGRGRPIVLSGGVAAANPVERTILLEHILVDNVVVRWQREAIATTQTRWVR